MPCGNPNALNDGEDLRSIKYTGFEPWFPLFKMISIHPYRPLAFDLDYTRLQITAREVGFKNNIQVARKLVFVKWRTWTFSVRKAFMIETRTNYRIYLSFLRHLETISTTLKYNSSDFNSLNDHTLMVSSTDSIVTTRWHVKRFDLGVKLTMF